MQGNLAQTTHLLPPNLSQASRSLLTLSLRICRGCLACSGVFVAAATGRSVAPSSVAPSSAEPLLYKETRIVTMTLPQRRKIVGGSCVNF